MVVAVKNNGKIPRLLGPKLGHINPGEVRYFEGDDADEIQRVIASKAFSGIIGKPLGLDVFYESEVFDLLEPELLAEPQKIEGLPIGVAVALLAHAKAHGKAELLVAVQPYATKPQLAQFFQ